MWLLSTFVNYKVYKIIYWQVVTEIEGGMHYKISYESLGK